MIDKIDNLFAKLDEWLTAYGIGVCIVFAMFYTSANVIARYVFGNPIKGMHHIIAVAMVPMAYLGLGYAWRTKGTFVAANVLLDKLTGKPRWLLEIFFHLVALIPLAGVIGYFSLLKTIWSYRNNDMIGGADLLFISWPIRASIVVGCFLLGVSVSISLIRLLIDHDRYHAKERKQGDRK